MPLRTDATGGRKPRVIWKVEFQFLDARGTPLKAGHLSASQLQKAMETAETPGSVALFRMRFLGKYQIYKRSRLKADLRRIKKLYRYHGFYQAQVFFDERIDLKVLAGANRYRPYERVSIRVRIMEGPQIKITEIKYKWPKRFVLVARSAKGKRGARLQVGVQWHDAPPTAAALRDALKHPILKVGQGFSTPRYKLWKGVLLKRLQDRSYALASIRGRVIISKEDRSAQVTLWINPLIPCQFGEVKIINNRRVSSALIMNLMKFERGKAYKVQQLVNTQRALFALGLFRTVSVKPDLDCAKVRMLRQLGGVLSAKQRQRAAGCLAKWHPPTQKDAPLVIPITVDLQEDKFQLFKFGVGIAIDGQRNLIGASFGLNFLHFLGGLRELQLQLSPGYAVLPDIIRRFDHGPELMGSITFKQPVFMDRTGEVGLRILYRRTEEIGDADYQTLTPSIWFERPLWGRLTGRMSFNVELAFDVQNPLSLERENYQLAYFEQQFVWDLRNDPLNTTRGFFFSLTLQQAPFGTFQYIKLSPELRFFLGLPAGIVLAGKLLYGIMWSQRTGTSENCPSKGPCLRTVSDVLRQSPLTQRFTSGGANSVRGWTARYLGPLGCRIQKEVYREVTSAEPVTPRGGKPSVGVRVVRQVQQKSEAIPDPVDPNSAQKSARARLLYPLLKRGKTCRPAQVQVMQARAADLASRRHGLPLDERPGLLPLVQRSALQVVPTGGHHLIEGSLELRIPLAFLSKSLGVVAFVDAGVVQLEPQFEVLEELIPSVSVGGGVRFRTPVGALRLDLAFRVAPDDDRYPLQSHWQIHFSFGEAF